MTEEPKKASEILLEKLEAFRKEMIAEIKSSKTSTVDIGKLGQHQNIEEVAECPTCKAKLIEKFRPEIEKDLLKSVKEKLKSKDLVTCIGCGEIVSKEEKECPSCHGKYAH